MCGECCCNPALEPRSCCSFGGCLRETRSLPSWGGQFGARLRFSQRSLRSVRSEPCRRSTHPTCTTISLGGRGLAVSLLSASSFRRWVLSEACGSTADTHAGRNSHRSLLLPVAGLFLMPFRLCAGRLCPAPRPTPWGWLCLRQ